MRRITLKQRDGGMDRVVLLLADTRTNRHALRAARPQLDALFPTPARTAMAALASGSNPAASTLVLL